MSRPSSYLLMVCALFVCGALGENYTIKTYTGYRLDPKSVRSIYYFDLVIAVIEVIEKNRVINCELISMQNDEIGIEMLANLTRIGKPKLLSQDKMMSLIALCDQLDPQRVDPEKAWYASRGINCSDQNSTYEIYEPSPSFYGFISGTKWCGPMDTASTFFDLGSNMEVDLCCRTHDMCPSLIIPNSTRYDLTNDSEYTRSLCICDKRFYNCLKNANSTIGDEMGKIYFNVLGVKCFHTKSGKTVFESPEPY